jgi:murein DD-endopeptidase MepM/ murein hydrolase activator NlpD
MTKCCRRTNLEVEESEAPIPRRSSSHIRYLILLPASGVFILMAMISSMVFSNLPPDDEPKAVNETLDRDHVPSLDNPLAGFLGKAPSTTNDDRELRIAELSIEDGGTLLGALAEQGIAHKEAYAASLALESVFDPRTLKAGQALTAGLGARTENGDDLHLRRLTFVPETDRKIVIEHQNDERFEAAEQSIQHTVDVELAAGTISTNLYEAARIEGIPSTVILEAYRLLGHAVDFQRDIRAGDKFALGYEQFDDGDAGGTHPGELLFTSIGLSSGVVQFLRYTTRDGYTGFFDSDGRSADTALLKTPVDSGRLSSLFGKRDHPMLGFTRMHKGLDFSAPLGAIVVAAGDGIVSKRERNGGFGNYVQIEHSGDYATAYAHLSRYAAGLNAGDRVRQGETIGYVGATGLATGPNLHYEVLHNGSAVDPVTVNSPPQKVLAGEELERLQDAFSEFEFSQVPAGFRKLVQAEHRAEAQND